jgi:Tfp pilus assembly protein PilF
VQLLYRIDVSEAKLKKVLHENPNEDAAHLIADLIMERIAIAKKARASFSKDDNNAANTENNYPINRDDEGAERL